jgi:hypothetical protein
LIWGAREVAVGRREKMLGRDGRRGRRVVLRVVGRWLCALDIRARMVVSNMDNEVKSRDGLEESLMLIGELEDGMKGVASKYTTLKMTKTTPWRRCIRYDTIEIG